MPRFPHPQQRHSFVAVAATASLAGWTGLFDGEETGRLDLTVQNERAAPVTVQVEVVDDKGTLYETLPDSGIVRIDGADHFGLISKSDRCVEEVLAFLPMS